MSVYNMSYQTPKLHSFHYPFKKKDIYLSDEHIHTLIPPLLLQIRERNVSVFSHCSEINSAMPVFTIFLNTLYL